MRRAASSRSSASPVAGLYRNALGEISPASHMNFVIANGVVVVPVYGTPTQAAALEALQAVFPGRQVVGVSSRGLLGCGEAGGGSFHCITQQEPRARWYASNARSPSPPSRPSYGPDMKANIAKTEAFVREAAKRGAQVVLPSELFQGIYFCTRQDPKWFATAHPVTEHPCVLALQKLARELGVVIPISFFEKDGPRYYNSVAIADADGEILGVYRKSHIPDGPGYQEKYYFRPGDTGFKAWTTQARHASASASAGTSGTRRPRAPWCSRAPRCCSIRRPSARSPTTRRSTPHRSGSAPCRATRSPTPCRSSRPTASGSRTTTARSRNSMAIRSSPTIAARSSQSFGATDEGVLVHTFDLTEIESYRADWGFFRDRRPDLYAKNLV